LAVFTKRVQQIIQNGQDIGGGGFHDATLQGLPWGCD
jgi:hypothetical protein